MYRCQRGAGSEYRPQENGGNFRKVAREKVINEFANVGINHAPLFDGGDDARVIVIGENHVRCFFGDICSGDAHCDTDIRAFDSGGVVYAVAGHRDDFAVCLKRVHDSHFMFGRDAGKDIYRFDFFSKGFVAHVVQVCAGEDLVVFAYQADVLRDGARGVGIIAGNHHGADSRFHRFAQRDFYLLARRVNHADKPDENQVVFQIFWRKCLFRYVFFDAVGDAEDAERAACHCVVRGEDFLSLFVRQREGFVVHPLIAGAEVEDDIRCAFDDDDIPIAEFSVVKRGNIFRARVVYIVYGHHAFALGVEGDFAFARIRGFDLGIEGAGFRRRDEERAFGRVADDAVGLLHLARAGDFELRVVVENAQPKRGERGGVIFEGDGFPVYEEVAARLVACAGDFYELPVHP